MINLLSASAKKKLWNQYLMRLGAVFFLALALLELFAAALFIPAFYSVHTTTSGLANVLEQSRARSPEENKTTALEVQSVRNDLDLLRPGKKTIDALPSSLIESIVSVKPKGITIKNFSYARAGETLTILLSGVAANRDDILMFKNELGKNPLFEKPKSGEYIIKKTNISFSISLTMKI